MHEAHHEGHESTQVLLLNNLVSIQVKQLSTVLAQVTQGDLNLNM